MIFRLKAFYFIENISGNHCVVVEIDEILRSDLDFINDLKFGL